MEWKCWNIRDETTDALKRMLEKTYKDIEHDYAMLRRLVSKDDAIKLVEHIYRLKGQASDMELEILRRHWNGTSQEDAER